LIDLFQKPMIDDIKVKMALQAFDAYFRHWYNVIVTEIKIDDSCVKVHWNGFQTKFDCWVNLESIRYPIAQRLLNRNAVSKLDFPMRTKPAFLKGKL